MTKILFICHGNICRSPMAEFVMKKLVSDAGLDSDFFIASAATSTDEIGSPVYRHVREILSRDGYSTLDAVVPGRVELLPKSLFHYKPNHRWADAYLYLIEILYPEVEL